MDKSKMIEIVKKQQAIDMNCNIEDFHKDGIVFCEAKENEGRRKFDRQYPFLEAATMGKSTIVPADRDILVKIKQERIYLQLPLWRLIDEKNNN